jgi:ABC-type multidrug transport system fused ATPase/permease subunit
MHGTPVIYFKSLNRPFTVLGVDRSLFYLFVAIGLAIAFSARLALVMDVVAGMVVTIQRFFRKKVKKKLKKYLTRILGIFCIFLCDELLG